MMPTNDIPDMVRQRDGIDALIAELQAEISAYDELEVAPDGAAPLFVGSMAEVGIPPNNAEVMTERLAILEGTVDGLRIIKPIILTAAGIVAVVVIAGIAFLGSQSIAMNAKIDAASARGDGRVDALAAKIDVLPDRLDRQSQAMQAQMAVQTSAIASSLVAARQLLSPAAVSPPVLPPVSVTPVPTRPAARSPR